MFDLIQSKLVIYPSNGRNLEVYELFIDVRKSKLEAGAGGYSWLLLRVATAGNNTEQCDFGNRISHLFIKSI